MNIDKWKLSPSWKQQLREEIFVYSEMTGNTNAQCLTEDISKIVSTEIIEKLIMEIRAALVQEFNPTIEQRLAVIRNEWL